MPTTTCGMRAANTVLIVAHGVCCIPKSYYTDYLITIKSRGGDGGGGGGTGGGDGDDGGVGGVVI